MPDHHRGAGTRWAGSLELAVTKRALRPVDSRHHGGLVGAGALGYTTSSPACKQLGTDPRPQLHNGFSPIVLLRIMLWTEDHRHYAARAAGNDNERRLVVIARGRGGSSSRRPSQHWGQKHRGGRHVGHQHPCGKVSIAVNNLGRVRGRRVRRGQRRPGGDSAAWSTTCTSTSRSPGRGSGSGAGRRGDGDWGPPGLVWTSTSRSSTWRRMPGSIGITGVIGWYVPPWMVQEVPRHHRLEEPEQVRRPVQDLRVRGQGLLEQ